MKMIKRHKGLAFVCLLAIILVAILAVIFSRMFFNKNKSEYGDRLNGIVNISTSTLDGVKAKISDNENVLGVKIRTQGKIIYTIITLNDKVSKDKAKEYASTSLSYYDDDVLGCYDFEYILTQELDLGENEEDTSYIIVGQKTPDNEKISWTKNQVTYEKE